MLAWITKLFGSFAKIFSNKNVRDSLNFLTPLALDVVKMLATDSSILSSAAKRAKAVDLVAEKVKASNTGLNITSSLINLAIEIAVQEVKHLVK